MAHVVPQKKHKIEAKNSTAKLPQAVVIQFEVEEACGELLQVRTALSRPCLYPPNFSFFGVKLYPPN